MDTNKLATLIISLLFLFLTIISIILIITKKQPEYSFYVVCLGAYGGLDLNNLNGYLLGEYNLDKKSQRTFISLDAGNLLNGMKKGFANDAFMDFSNTNNNLTNSGFLFRNLIKAYLITHDHLDHVSGLVIDSTDASGGDVYGTNDTLTGISNNIFNWEIWPNFLNIGEKPLDVFNAKTIEYNQNYSITNTNFRMTVFPLSHGTNPVKNQKKMSTAYLIDLKGNQLMYFGDTGADYLENVNYLDEIWTYIAPKIANNTLKAIMIECSYTNSQPDNLLFGHLNPKWLLSELHTLQSKVAKLVDKSVKYPLSGFNVVVTHIKPANLIYATSYTSVEKIQQELKDGNDMKINFIYPEQGLMIPF